VLLWGFRGFFRAFRGLLGGFGGRGSKDHRNKPTHFFLGTLAFLRFLGDFFGLLGAF